MHDSNHKHDTKESQSELMRELVNTRNSVFARFPLLFTLLGTFGLVTTLYGFQHILQKIPLIANNPFIALATGLVILVFTGTLYKKLD